MFTPSNAAGAVKLIAHHYAGAQTGFVDGQTITGLSDTTGNGNNWTVSGTGPLFSASAMNGKGGIGPFAGDRYLTMDGTKMPFDNAGYTFVWVAQTDTKDSQTLLAKGQIPNSRFWFVVAGQLERYQNVHADAFRIGAPSFNAYSFRAGAGTPNIGVESWWVEGRVAASSAATLNPRDPNVWALGHTAVSWSSGTLGDLLVFSPPLTDQELAQLETEADQYWQIERGPINLAFITNSLGIIYATPPYPDATAKSMPLDPSGRYQDFLYLGGSGQGLGNFGGYINAGALGEPVTGAINIVHIAEGQNSAHYGGNLGDYATPYKALIEQIRDVGWFVVYETIPAFKWNDSPSNLDAWRLAENELLRNWDKPDGVFLNDVAMNYTIGRVGAQTDTAFFVDNVHMTTAGAAVRAGTIQNTFSSIIEPQEVQGLTLADLNAISSLIPTSSQNATATRINLATELARLDVATSTRTAGGTYVAAPTTTAIVNAIIGSKLGKLLFSAQSKVGNLLSYKQSGVQVASRAVTEGENGLSNIGEFTEVS